MKNLKNTERRGLKSVFSLAAAALLVLAASGCASSDPKPTKAYKTPDSLCGTAIEPSLLEPALPPGKKISTKVTNLIGYDRCLVRVDDESALSVLISWRGGDTTTLNVASTERGGGMIIDTQLTEDRRYAWSEKGGVGQVHCPEPSVSHRKVDSRLFVTIVSLSDEKTTEPEMKKLITAYTDSVSNSDECRASKRS
ncbi:hypothetical protein [Streptomyces katsurahamanus]|uniref:DUF3558 domain-containing protein n=1 Tax=Streptomyces katsurahamanus TaxID=2577098 RepID=A0ABW9NLT0_9ACTN|nr:hypothetical protein [Streptomyces katsurahamanus]MQS34208.1 hypothetical protein [Streptomyces katsurahamanus]